MDPCFLTLDEVLALHEDQIRRYGGAIGLRDAGLLSSAVATPRATFAGELLHGTLVEIAAAYLYHLARNHPFVDGNKRTALAACLAFLWLNDPCGARAYDAVAAGSSPRALAALTRSNASRRILARWASSSG